MTRIAFVGAGFMATEHARAFAALPGVEIVGFVGRSPEKVRTLAESHGAPVFDDIASLWAETRADAVVVAVPELSCRAVCEQVFEYPWTSLLEKPVGRNLADAEHLLALAAEKQHRTFVALNRRSFAATRGALDTLAADDGPRFILVHDTQDTNVARSVGQPEAVIADWMFANSIHLVDYVRIFGRGEIEDVTVGLPFDDAKPDSVSATIRFSSGDRAVYFGAWNKPGPWYVTAANGQTRIELRPLEQLGVQKLGERALAIAEADPDDTNFKPGLLHQAREFLKLLSGSPSTLATLDDATQSMRLVARIYGRD